MCVRSINESILKVIRLLSDTFWVSIECVVSSIRYVSKIDPLPFLKYMEFMFRNTFPRIDRCIIFFLRNLGWFGFYIEFMCVVKL